MRVKGFVLLPVLIMIQLLTLMGLHDLRSTLSGSAMEIQIQSGRRTEAIVRAALTKLEDEFEGRLPRCLISNMPVNDLFKKDERWWESQACGGNFAGIRYYYAIEFLGNDACAIVSSANPAIAAYYRITFIGIVKQVISKRYAYQSVVVTPKIVQATCEGVLHHVSAGRQTYRKL